MRANENRGTEKKNPSAWVQILIGVAIGAVLGVGGMIFTLNGKVERLEEQVKNLKEQIKAGTGNDQPGENTDSTTKGDPTQLSIIIRKKQSEKVKISYTETNCFTKADLATFKEKRIQDQVVNELMNDNSFIDLIISIKKMPASARQTLLEESKKIAKPTWGELSKITSKGQTEDGQKAELLIAEAIVAKINEMIKLSVDELKGKYK